MKPWTKKLGGIDWSYKGALWKGTLIVEGKMSTSARAVKDTIAEVEKHIGLEDLAKTKNGLAA
jgi:hypothetical protein